MNSTSVLAARRPPAVTLSVPHDLLPWLIVPIRSLAFGKSRLGSLLDAAERRTLNETFLRHVLAVAAQWPGAARTLVVSPCEDALSLAHALGVRTLCQARVDGDGLNAGLQQAALHVRATEPAAPLLMLSSDLPLVAPADLAALHAEANARRSSVIATDRFGLGTNALYLHAGAPLRLQFGVDSAWRHAMALKEAGHPVRSLRIDGLAFDIDTPADYQDWASSRLAARMR